MKKNIKTIANDLRDVIIEIVHDQYTRKNLAEIIGKLDEIKYAIAESLPTGFTQSTTDTIICDVENTLLNNPAPCTMSVCGHALTYSLDLLKNCVTEVAI